MSMEKLEGVICGGPNAFSKCLLNQLKKTPHINKALVYQRGNSMYSQPSKFVTTNMYPSNSHERIDRPSLYIVIGQYQVT